MDRRSVVLKFFEEQKEETQNRISQGIEKYRKGNAKIKFSKKDGMLPKEISVKVIQRNHKFRFGANLFMLDEFESEEKNKIYREKFPENLNLATLPLYWNTLEPEKGKPRFEKDCPRIYRRPSVDLCVEYCKEKNIEAKGHFLCPNTWYPDWLGKPSVEEHKKALHVHYDQIAKRYADDISSFEVTNETTYGNNDVEFFNDEEYLEWNYKTARSYFKNNGLIINEGWNWWPAQTIYNTRNAYYMSVEKLLNNDYSYLDSIGLQCHAMIEREKEQTLAGGFYNPRNLYRLLDVFSKLGKPLQITEMTMPAYDNHPENEEIQAEIIRNIYSIFFSHPAMEAIIYWNLVDGYAHGTTPGDMTKGENVYYGGLLRFDLSEKPSYKALTKLIREEWNTNTVVPAIDGVAEFRGFLGEYDIEVYCDGKKTDFSFNLDSDKEIEFVL